MQPSFTADEVRDLCAMIFIGAKEAGINVDLLLDAATENVHFSNKGEDDTPLTTAFKAMLAYGADMEKRRR